MAEKVNVTSDEVNKANEIRERYSTLTYERGRICFAQRALDVEAKEIDLKFDVLVKEEEQFLKELNDKYGAGTLNVETGEFTPVSG